MRSKSVLNSWTNVKGEYKGLYICISVQCNELRERFESSSCIVYPLHFVLASLSHTQNERVKVQALGQQNITYN